MSTLENLYQSNTNLTQTGSNSQLKRQRASEYCMSTDFDFICMQLSL